MARWLVLAVVVVVAGTTFIAAVPRTSKDPTSLIDRRNAAWNNGDTSAVASLYAPNAVLTFINSSTYVGRAAITAQIKDSYRCKNHTKRVSPVSVHGTFAATFMSDSSTSKDADCQFTATYLSVYQIKAGKVVREWYLLPGYTSPLNNAAG
jgi:uncharacterized protein (TIGR02246 family)